MSTRPAQRSSPASRSDGSAPERSPDFHPSRTNVKVSNVMLVSAPTPWLARRLFPLLATVVLIVIGMVSTIWRGAHLTGNHAWPLPDDLWGTLVAARRLLHLDWSGLYTQPTGLVGFPGAALILVPVVD